ncbi:MAG: lipase family protein [Treponema sp.]|nr:lipase family protein [Treponema sp.]
MKITKAVCLTFFALCSLPLFSKPIEFPVSGLFTREPEPIPTVIDWDESQFGKDSPTVYNHSIARMACLLSEVSYLSVRPAFSDARSQTLLLMGIDKDDIEYHYKLDYNDPTWGYDQCAFTITKKEINSAKGKKTLVFVIIRGTPAEASEWISNFDVGNASEDGDVLHRGFLKTSLQIETALLTYLIKYKIQPSEAYFLITGHSRGGAVTNLLAANLSKNPQFNTEHIYAYAFASPNVTTDINSQNEKYNFIWNIVNAEDIVPAVPLSRDRWKYHKFGHVLTLANAWNTDSDTYYNDLYPKMNKYYVDFVKRDYAPFKIGPFVPIQITRFLTALYSTVNKYYGKLLGLNKIISSIMWKIFPPDDDTPVAPAPPPVAPAPQPVVVDVPGKTITESARSSKSLSENLLDWANNSTDGLIDYTMDAFLDMHANETYLAWMLSGDEHEIFSDLGSTQLLINGSFECAVFDKDHSLVARVKDSRIIYTTLRSPIASVQILGHLLTIGFPANADFTVVLYRGSIAPSPVTLQIEHYSASGQLLNTTEKQRIGPHKCIAYKVKAGKILLDADALEIEKIKGAEKRQLIRDGKLNYAWKFNFVPEININTDASFGFGAHIGTQMIYASALLNLNPNNVSRSLTLSTGLGTQQNIIGPLMMNIDGWYRFIWDFDDNAKVSYVPALRLTLSLKPRHRWQIFAGPVFDFHIDGYNDAAFDSSITPKKMGAIHFGDSVEAIPSIQFGLRF